MKIKISIMTIMVMLFIGLCACEREDNTPANGTETTNSRQNNNHGSNPSDTLGGNPENTPGNNSADTLGENHNPLPYDNTEDSIGVDWVDLGLPSGLLWATRNIGADTPEDMGDLFAWGETTPKDDYTIQNYIYYRRDDEGFGYTKYCGVGGLGYHGFIDRLYTLQACDDAATVNWSNGARTPTKEEWDELRTNCRRIWTTQNGVSGCLCTGPNGRTLFLPIRIVADGNSSIYYNSYWSASISQTAEHHAYYVYVDNTINYISVGNRPVYNCCMVRAVRSTH